MRLRLLPATRNSLPPRWTIAVLVALLAGCSTTTTQRGQAPPPMVSPWKVPGAEIARGKASWYGPGFHGRRTASGERFDMNELTAAHRTLPFGTLVRVRNAQNGLEVVVRINDRGPRVRDRIIDLSQAAAAAIELIEAGEGPVVLNTP